MKSGDYVWSIALSICLAVLINLLLDLRVKQSSSFVGYSQSCWQINDTLHVVTAKGDTVRLDVSRLEGAE